MVLKNFLFIFILLLTLPGWSQAINFESVVVQQPVIQGDENGLAIIPRLTIRGYSGRKLSLNAYLYDLNQKPIAANTGSFRASNGQIAVAKAFQAGSDYVLYEAVENPAQALFIPYNQLPFAKGQHPLLVQLQLFDSANNQLLQTSNFATFTYRKDED